MEHGTVAPTKNICLNYAIDIVFLLATIYMPTCLGGKTYLINDFFPYLVLRHRNQQNNFSKVINIAELSCFSVFFECIIKMIIK